MDRGACRQCPALPTCPRSHYSSGPLFEDAPRPRQPFLGRRCPSESRRHVNPWQAWSRPRLSSGSVEASRAPLPSASVGWRRVPAASAPRPKARRARVAGQLCPLTCARLCDGQGGRWRSASGRGKSRSEVGRFTRNNVHPAGSNENAWGLSGGVIDS